MHLMIVGVSFISAKNDGWIPITSKPAIHRYRSYIDSRVATTTSTTPAPAPSSSSSTLEDGLIVAGQRAAAPESHQYGYAVPEQDYHVSFLLLKELAKKELAKKIGQLWPL